ncbi:MAG TPA: ATP-binding cassette domain-containing protein, partial [Roseiflexaceae bacterium]
MARESDSDEVPLIAMRGISKRFGGIQALENVDFTLRRGEVMALVGENGAGKSTLIKILAGVYQGDSGQILMDGQP